MTGTIIAARRLYTGVDISAEMINRARAIHAKKIKLKNRNFLVEDCEKLSLNDADYDIVTAIALIEYFQDPTNVLNEIKRVLKPEGIVLITVPHKRCINFKIRDSLNSFIS